MQPNLLQPSQNRKWLIYIGLFLFFLLWQWNGLVFNLWTGFDMGVQNMELLTASSSQLHYGKDLLVTPYPPLSWLCKGVVPVFTKGYGEAVFQSLAINIFSALLRVIVLAIFWKDARDKSARIIAAVVSVFVFLHFPVSRGTALLDLCILTALLLICKLLIYLQDGKTVSGRKNAWTAATVAAVSILLSVPQLVKFSYIAMAAALLIITAVILLVHKRYAETALLFGCYVVSTCLLWILSGEQLRYLPSFVYASLHIVSGYSEVMSLPFYAYEGAFRDFLFALIVCVCYGLMLLYLLVHDRRKASACFIIAPFLFLSFKEAFVRSDEPHTAQFVQELTYTICYLLFVFNSHSETDKNVQLLFSIGKRICCVLLALLMVADIVNNKWYPASTIYSDFNSIYSHEKYEAYVANSKNSVCVIPEYQTLFQDIEPYPDSTLGMLSGEQTFFIAYDLIDRFKLNPIVSLWENCNSYSETVAADHYYGNDAPDILLYRPEPLDNGYFVFRMGTILQSLLENYHAGKVDDNGYLVLQHNEQGKRESIMLSEPVEVSVGSPIEVPTAENAFVFMKVNWKLTPLGKLASFILKPSQTYVTIQTEGGTRDYRFFRTLANNGLYVSSLIENSQDLANLINGDLGNNTIENITLQGNPLLYQKDFEVSFYAVPFTQGQVDYQATLSNITVEFASELLSSDYELFYAQDGMFNEVQKEHLSIGNGKTELTVNIPSEGWNTLRLDFPQGIGGTYDITSLTLDGKACIVDGANDAQVTQTESGWKVRAGTEDPFIMFHMEGK